MIKWIYSRHLQVFDKFNIDFAFKWMSEQKSRKNNVYFVHYCITDVNV